MPYWVQINSEEPPWCFLLNPHNFRDDKLCALEWSLEDALVLRRVCKDARIPHMHTFTFLVAVGSAFELSPYQLIVRHVPNLLKTHRSRLSPGYVEHVERLGAGDWTCGRKFPSIAAFTHFDCPHPRYQYSVRQCDRPSISTFVGDLVLCMMTSLRAHVCTWEVLHSLPRLVNRWCERPLDLEVPTHLLRYDRNRRREFLQSVRGVAAKQKLRVDYPDLLAMPLYPQTFGQEQTDCTRHGVNLSDLAFVAGSFAMTAWDAAQTIAQGAIPNPDQQQNLYPLFSWTPGDLDIFIPFGGVVERAGEDDIWPGGDIVFDAIAQSLCTHLPSMVGLDPRAQRGPSPFLPSFMEICEDYSDEYVEHVRHFYSDEYVEHVSHFGGSGRPANQMAYKVDSVLLSDVRHENGGEYHQRLTDDEMLFRQKIVHALDNLERQGEFTTDRNFGVLRQCLIHKAVRISLGPSILKGGHLPQGYKLPFSSINLVQYKGAPRPCQRVLDDFDLLPCQVAIHALSGSRAYAFSASEAAKAAIMTRTLVLTMTSFPSIRPWDGDDPDLEAERHRKINSFGKQLSRIVKYQDRGFTGLCGYVASQRQQQMTRPSE